MNFLLIVLFVIVWCFILSAVVKYRIKLAANGSVDVASKALVKGVYIAYESIGDTTEQELYIQKQLEQNKVQLKE